MSESGLAESDEFVGCSEGEIRALEDQFGVDLPAAYESCLRYIGRDSQTLFTGENFTVDTLPAQRQLAEQRLTEWNVDFSFDDTEFVFFGNQGYAFLFFDTEEGPDPPVHSLVAGDPPSREAESFSRWLLERVDRHIRVRTDG